MDDKLIRVFMGYDPRNAVRFSVLSHSIHRQASRPVAVIPLMLSQLDGLLWRTGDSGRSTDLLFARFLIPYLSDFEGWSLFTDGDMIVRDDIAKLWDLRDAQYAVMCVKHNRIRPSVILFNNARCAVLIPEYVNTASSVGLHQFKWLEDNSLIGELPASWDHLAGVDPPCRGVKLVHMGGPEYRDEWMAEKLAMLHCDQHDSSFEGQHA